MAFIMVSFIATSIQFRSHLILAAVALVQCSSNYCAKLLILQLQVAFCIDKREEACDILNARENMLILYFSLSINL